MRYCIADSLLLRLLFFVSRYYIEHILFIKQNWDTGRETVVMVRTETRRRCFQAWDFLGPSSFASLSVYISTIIIDLSLILQNTRRKRNCRRTQKRCRAHGDLAQRRPIPQRQAPTRQNHQSRKISTIDGPAKLLCARIDRPIHSNSARTRRYGTLARCCAQRECTGCCRQIVLRLRGAVDGAVAMMMMKWRQK